MSCCGPRRRMTHCCCFSVRTGTLILAILGLAGASIKLLSYAGAEAMGGGEDGFNNMLDGLDADFREWREEGDITEQELETMESMLGCLRRAYPYMAAGGMACSLFAIAKHAMLLFGVLYRRSCLFLPYLVIGLAGLIVATLMMIAGCVLVFMYTTAIFGLVFTTFASLALALCVYLWHVVLAHYYEVKENPDSDRLPIVIQEQPPAYEQEQGDAKY